MKKKSELEESWIDPNTDLEWQLIEPDKMNWQDATDYADQLEYAGFNDWRLPTIDEFESGSSITVSPDFVLYVIIPKTGRIMVRSTIGINTRNVHLLRIIKTSRLFCVQYFHK